MGHFCSVTASESAGLVADDGRQSGQLVIVSLALNNPGSILFQLCSSPCHILLLLLGPSNIMGHSATIEEDSD